MCVCAHACVHVCVCVSACMRESDIVSCVWEMIVKVFFRTYCIHVRDHALFTYPHLHSELEVCASLVVLFSIAVILLAK